MGSSTQPQQQIKCLATFDFRNPNDEGYVANLDYIRGKYPPFLDTKFREVPPVEALEKTEDDYFTLDFVTARAHISGLYEQRGVYLFGIRPNRIDNRDTGQPFEIMQGIDFNFPNVHVKRIPAGVDYKTLGDPVEASYTLKDLVNVVNTLARGFQKAGNQWGPSVTTLIGATSEAIKFIAMERHVVIGLNIIPGNNVCHFPSNRLVRILRSWSKISKSIKNAKYDYELKYPIDNGAQIAERVTKLSAGQIIALINSKDGSKEEKESRKQGKEKKGKRKMDDFEESEERFKKGKIQKLNKTQKGIQISSGSAEGHKYRGMAGAKDLHVALNIDHDEQKSALLKTVEDKGPEEIQKAAESEGYTSELFNVRMIPRGMYTDSDSDSEAEDDKASVSKDDTSDFELFNVRMKPNGMYIDSDSDSDSDSEAEDEKTPTEPKEESPRLDFPILVKHGTKRPAEAGAGDKDSKLEEMDSEGAEKKATDDTNEGGGSLIV